MYLSLNIISKMVDLSGVNPEDLALKLTMATAEIEGVEYINKHLESVITAKALKVMPHPDADKLTLVDLDTGTEKLRVVCGAPNHKDGDIVALAPVGTDFGEIVIKKTKIRGQESSGMLCSEKELGLSDDHSGIMILPPDTKLGVSMKQLYPDFADVCLEIDNKSITHRPDLWSHRGFAREIGALLDRPVKDVVDHSLLKTLADKEKLSVRIDCPEAAPRYSGLMVKNVTVKPSPTWLQAAVYSIGMRPINNIVDITNYVMAELGEPMHAFDRKKLRGSEIIVRLAGDNEPMTTLDSSEYKLCAEDIVIADSGGPVALAGVMGGENSEIDDSTTEIVLEAANFNPVNIRKTAHRYDQRTEAAIRFEKSLTPEVTVDALLRCYELIKESCPEAEAVTTIADAYPQKQEKISISTTTDFIRQRIGKDITDDEIIRILKALDFDLAVKGSSLDIGVPDYRATKDISIPEDIVEEVGRIYGYDNIPPRPPYVPCEPPEKNFFRTFERLTKSLLASYYGMVEISGYSFIGENMLNKLGINEDRELRLKNPLSQEQDRLRRSLVPNIINNVALNQRYHTEFRLFEQNRVYLKDDRTSKDLIAEKTMTTGAVFNKTGETPLFYDAKNIIIGLLNRLRVRSYAFKPAQTDLPPYAHPARSLEVLIQNEPAGLIFELHPKTMKAFEISGPCAFFDIDLDRLFACKKSDINFNELQKFPPVPFELSVIADSRTYSEDILTVVQKKCKKNLASVDVISIYEGKPIPEGKKSVSLKIVFEAKDKTLSPEEVDALQKDVIAALNKAGYELRK